MALADIFDTSVVEVGKIKIGCLGDERTSQSGRRWRPPVKLDHFVITTLHRDAGGQLVPDAALMDSLKEIADRDGKLRSLPVAFLSNQVEDVLQSHYVWYVGKKLGARSDGRVVEFFHDPATGKPLETPRRVAWEPHHLDALEPGGTDRRLFKLFTTLNVVLAAGQARWGGVYKYRTTGVISGRQLFDSLTLLHRLSGGVLRGPTFRLVVRPMTVSPGGKTSTVHVVHVEYIANDPRALLTQAREQRTFELQTQHAMLETERQYKALVAAQVDDEPDEDLVAEEPRALPERAGGPSVEDLLGPAIDAAETADDLRDVWESARAERAAGRLPQEAFDRLAGRKDARKAALPPPAPQAQPAQSPQSPPAEQPPAAAESPKPPAGTPAAPQKAGAAIVADILKLCTELGSTWGDVRAAHAAELGITHYRAQDLTPEQALKLVETLRADVNTRRAEDAAADADAERGAEAAGVN